MSDSKILHFTYSIAIPTFFSFFVFQTLSYFDIPKEIAATICAILASIGIILSIFYTKASVSVGLMLSSIIMALYIAFLYWYLFTGAYKFFIAFGLLAILLYSLYKITKK